MKLKVIEATANLKVFEFEVNKFLETHKVIDVKYSMSTVMPCESISYYSAVILYED